MSDNNYYLHRPGFNLSSRATYTIFHPSNNNFYTTVSVGRALLLNSEVCSLQLKNMIVLTDKEHLVSELTRSDSWSLDTNWNSLCVYNVGRKARSSDCIDTVLSVFKCIINIGCL